MRLICQQTQYDPQPEAATATPSAGTLVALAAEMMQEPEAAAGTTTQDEAGTAAEAASKGREMTLGTPDKMAGTDTTATTDGQQAAPQGPQGAANGPAAVERDNGRQPGGP